MDEGDILHILIIDEVGNPVTISLNSDGNEDEVPDAIVALDATSITGTSFTANWNLSENCLGYRLDVAEDEDFTTFVAGYEDLDVGNVSSYGVIGLDYDSTYYYRLRGYNDIGTGNSSNTIDMLTVLGVIQDIDGNIYTAITIGTQLWMVENLRTEHYRDGTPIRYLSEPEGRDITYPAPWANSLFDTLTSSGPSVIEEATTSAANSSNVYKFSSLIDGANDKYEIGRASCRERVSVTV
jgi:hypothetical protein